MAEQIQLKLSTLEELVSTAKRLHEESQQTGVSTIPVVRITKTADRQDNQLEDKFETHLLVEIISPVEVFEG